MVVVGAGISGLCTAHYLIRALSAAGRAAEILILEAEEVPGGKMRTIREGGFRMEWGPNGFLTNKPFSLDLVRDLGIEDRLSRSSDRARKRYVYSGGSLQRLPETPPMFLKSPLISWPGKLRIFCEPFAPPPPEGVDESLGDFARRRLGREALEKLIDPMVTGIFAGDPDRMSLRSCFPVIHDLERRYGGLVRGMISLRRERRKEGRAGEMSAGPGGVLMSFDHGVQTLTDILSERLSEGLHLGVRVDRVAVRDDRFRLTLNAEGRQEEMDTDGVVLATPAYGAAQILSGLDEGLAGALAGIPYSPISVVALGYDRETLGNPLDGFGFLIPRQERRRILGALWDSSVFPNRAPEGTALIRAMVGGVRAPELAALPEENLVSLVRQELSVTMGIRARPVLARVFRHDRGIPQYLVGHGRLLERMEASLAGLPGLYLNSNAYRGIALNDCVRESRETGERIARDLSP